MAEPDTTPAGGIPEPHVGDVPETDVPEASVPEASVPAANVPEASVPETAVAVDDPAIQPTETAAETPADGDVEAAVRDDADAEAERGRMSDRARAAATVSLQVVRGLVGVGIAAALVAGAGLLAPPSIEATPLTVTVDPQRADLLRACSGSLLRLGDDSGSDASRVLPVGAADTAVAAIGGDAQSRALGGGAGANAVVLAASDDAALAATQTQMSNGAADFAGLAVSGCAEPVSSAWLVGGATTVGRTALLVLTNPTEVAADVTVRMWGADGAITAPGMAGIRVEPQGQRVLPLAGFAPDVAAPVVHVEARGGQVAATLQSSVIRVLEPGGVEVISPGAAPARNVVIPAVRIAGSAGVAATVGRADHEDLDSIVRIANTGGADASVEVSVQSATGSAAGTTFTVDVPAGRVLDSSLSAGLAFGAAPLIDDTYTVTLSSDEPVTAAVRTSTASASGGDIDLAWFSSATVLRADTLVATAAAPGPMLVLDNRDGADRQVTVEPQNGGAPMTVTVPAFTSTAVVVAGGTGYLLRDVDGMRAGLSYAGSGALAAQTLRSARVAETTITVRP